MLSGRHARLHITIVTAYRPSRDGVHLTTHTAHCWYNVGPASQTLAGIVPALRRRLHRRIHHTANSSACLTLIQQWQRWPSIKTTLDQCSAVKSTTQQTRNIIGYCFNIDPPYATLAQHCTNTVPRYTAGEADIGLLIQRVFGVDSIRHGYRQSEKRVAI